MARHTPAWNSSGGVTPRIRDRSVRRSDGRPVSGLLDQVRQAASAVRGLDKLARAASEAQDPQNGLVVVRPLENRWIQVKDLVVESGALAGERVDRFIDDPVEAELVRLWEKRDDYHHLNPNVARDRRELEELALTKIRALGDIVFLRNPSV